MTTRPQTASEIEQIASEVFATIPESLRAPLGGIDFVVEDLPDRETCIALALESPMDLLGLYHGVDLLRKSTWDTPQDVDRIHLYRRPILAYVQDTGERLEDVVRHVLIHEIGHHYGYSDEDMDRIQAETD